MHSGRGLFRFSDQVLREGRKRLDERVELTPLSSYPRESFNGVISANPDLLESKAIGREGVHLYTLLLESDEPLTVRTIAARAHLPLGSVRYRLDKLKRFDLVQHTGRPKRYAALPKSQEELHEIVCKAGVEGKTKHRNTQHAKERAWFVAREIRSYRERCDSENLPRSMQPTHTWQCPECEYRVQSKHARLPRTCPECGCIGVAWKQMDRHFCKRTGSRRVAQNDSESAPR